MSKMDKNSSTKSILTKYNQDIPRGTKLYMVSGLSLRDLKFKYGATVLRKPQPNQEGAYMHGLMRMQAPFIHVKDVNGMPTKDVPTFITDFLWKEESRNTKVTLYLGVTDYPNGVTNDKGERIHKAKRDEIPLTFSRQVGGERVEKYVKMSVEDFYKQVNEHFHPSVPSANVQTEVDTKEKEDDGEWVNIPDGVDNPFDDFPFA